MNISKKEKTTKHFENERFSIPGIYGSSPVMKLERNMKAPQIIKQTSLLEPRVEFGVVIAILLGALIGLITYGVLRRRKRNNNLSHENIALRNMRGSAGTAEAQNDWNKAKIITSRLKDESRNLKPKKKCLGMKLGDVFLALRPKS